MFAKFRIEIEIFRKFSENGLTLTLKGFPLFAHWSVQLTKIENVWFCSGGFSYSIQEKLTAWRVDSSLNFTWKTDIALIASRFVKFNVEFTLQAVTGILPKKTVVYWSLMVQTQCLIKCLMLLSINQSFLAPLLLDLAYLESRL